MSLISPILLRDNVSAIIANVSFVCIVDSQSGDIYLLDDPSTTPPSFQQIGQPGFQFYSDGNTVWGVSPDQNAVWQYTGSGQTFTQAFSIPGSSLIKQIAALGGVLYVMLEDGSLYSVASGTSQQIDNMPGGATAIITNQAALYAFVPAAQQVLEYVGGAWNTVITAPAGAQLTSFIVGGSVVAIDANYNLYVYDSSAESYLGQIPACAQGALYGFTSVPTLLVASVNGGMFYNNPQNVEEWTQYIEGGPQISTLVGAGLVPFGLTSGGTAYILAQELPATPVGGIPTVPPPGRGLASPTSALTNYAQWMTTLRQQRPSMGSVPLNKLCIPGTHDSGCYSFETVLLFGIVLQSTANWAQTQVLPVKDQLQAGARFFDIRPQWSISRLDYYIYHGYIPTAVRFTDVLRSISVFSSSNPGEIIFVYLNKLNDIGILGNANDIFNDVVGALGSRLIAPQNLGDSYDALVNAGTNVAVSADVIPSQFSSQFISRTVVSNINSWAQTSSLSDLLKFIQANLVNVSGFWMTQCQLTPGSSLSINMINIPMWLADVSKQGVQNLLSTYPEATTSLNLFVVDMYDTSWTDLAFNLSLARLP